MALCKAIALLYDTKDETFGEAVSHLQHACQTYRYLRRVCPDNIELRVAGFWHDVGHSVDMDASCKRMCDASTGEDLGNISHERVAAELFRDALPASCCWLIEHHTTAKRYAATIDTGRVTTLSGPSMQTLECQGGKLSDAAVDEFRGHALFEQAMLLREADDSAKRKDVDASHDVFAALADTAKLMQAV